MQGKPTVAIVYGGKSAEYEVSLQTAFSVINAINKDKYHVLPVHITNNGLWLEGQAVAGKLDYKEQLLLDESRRARPSNEWLTPASMTAAHHKPDVIFPLLHGPNGEDGTVQGLFELLDVAYVGSGVSGSATTMDKVLMKDIFKAHDIAQADYFPISKYDWTRERDAVVSALEAHITYPCFVKPANLGSSIGISKSGDRASFIKDVDFAFQFDQRVVIEAMVVGREIEIGVVGNDELEVSVPGEIKAGHDFYDYEAKYKDGESTLIIPADVDSVQLDEIKASAKKAFKALNCNGLARADFFIRQADGQVLLNELNTMPGFTPYSMFPLLWKHAGVEYDELIDRLIRLGIERHQERQSIQYRID